MSGVRSGVVGEKLGLTLPVGSFTLFLVEIVNRRKIEDVAQTTGVRYRWEGDVLKWSISSAAEVLEVDRPEAQLARPRFDGQHEGDWLTTAGMIMFASFGFTRAAEHIAAAAAKIAAEYIEAAARREVGAKRPEDDALLIAVERMAGVLGRDHPDVQKYAGRYLEIAGGDAPATDPLGRYLTVQMYLAERQLPLAWVVQQRSAFGMALAARWRRQNPGGTLLKHQEPVWQFGSWGGATQIEPGTNRYTEADRPMFDAVYEDWRRAGKLPSTYEGNRS